MKILWVNQYFLHPTERGGQIRSLGILQQLHRWHEVHYAALGDPASPEGLDMAHTFSTRAYAVPHPVISRRSPAFLLQLARNIFGSSLPLAVSRYASPELLRKVMELEAEERFDCIVCDFVASGVHIPDITRAVIFQHNVETTIFERHAQHAATPLHRWFFGLQARRMHSYEERMCRDSVHVIAVSPIDAQRMRDMFKISHVSDVATGVDVDYFRASKPCQPNIDFVFVGSMDWLPNIEGMVWFTKEILPSIRRSKPACRVAIVGRKPDAQILELAASDDRIEVTGTVRDVRPYLWNSQISILPLRIGGGTRMKVYESMAAGLPVVSTGVGIEGLACVPGRDILVGDSPEEFANHCISLMDDAALRHRISESGLRLVNEKCSWEDVSRQFEKVLLEAAELSHNHGGSAAHLLTIEPYRDRGSPTKGMEQ
jgi:glycosyltransferase involved in cell wall biosynthesis